MKVLVTGCSGFIGWKVTELLLEQGHSVIGADNLNDAYDVRLKQWRLAILQEKRQFQFHTVDIGDKENVNQLFEQKPDAVVNLAARAGVRQSTEDPWIYYRTNTTGVLNLLELCRDYGVKKFILASTSSLYGDSNPRPFSEDANTDKPLSPYAASKKAAEVLCYTYHFLYGLDVSVLRFFTVYGPAGRPDMSIFRFIRWIAEGEPLTLFGDGSQERDFTYVDDIAEGVVSALRPLGYEVINLGSDKPVSLLYVIRSLEELLGKKAKIDKQPSHATDVPATWADVTKAKSLLGWTPQTTTEDGLRQSVEWYRNNRDWAKDIFLT